MKRLAFALPVALTRGVSLRPVRFEASRGPARQRDWGELASKATIVTLFSMMAMRISTDFARTGHVTGLLLVASEALVVVLTVFRRSAGIVDRSLRARILTMMSMFGPPLVRPAVAFVPVTSEAVTVLVSAVGLLIVIIGKLSLGRSFGLTPANRGVVSTGIYQFVRHPIYLGYLITHIGFVLANPLDWNLSVLAAADLALVMRARVEEQTLAKDSTYREYMQRVRFRLVPGLF
ncbi:MAG: isoprenylcysteine carboxyl methyltransferase [Acidobacteria bacterium]|nr:MAG: isoprenylcysteine carboxyl methyltransferase [Acidobacteriota bacterium]